MKLKYTLAALAATTLAANAATTYTIGNDEGNQAGEVRGQAFTASETGLNLANTTDILTGIPSGEYANLGALTGATIDLNSFTMRTSSSSDDADGALWLQVNTLADGSGTILASSDSANDWGATALNTDVTWDFANTTLSLDADTKYFALVSSTENTYTSVQINAELGTDNSYSGGDVVRSGAEHSNWDTQFRAEFTAIPEPSSTALLGLGGLALILRRRK